MEMTTFAYKDGVLAVDSRMVLVNWVDPTPQKKFRVLKDSVAVGCGIWSEVTSFIDWLAKDEEGERPQLSETSVVQFYPDNRIRVHESSGAFEYEGTMGAWGSGMPAALAALQCGKTPGEAIAIASKVDIYTGEPIFEMVVADVIAEANAQRAEEVVEDEPEMAE